MLRLNLQQAPLSLGGRLMVPNPGSDEAGDLGCTCPVLDNSRGQGWMCQGDLFWIAGDCPLHGQVVDEIEGYRHYD